ncbi:uncharacterized protein RJT21DRAFT_111152 [Scheffersomyces amazonensis]|uniref:uncharacterized protein n=1 Tax=Scheffersomyces amazonensis TaxID=1078765 RepID=UPI00315D0AD7
MYITSVIPLLVWSLFSLVVAAGETAEKDIQLNVILNWTSPEPRRALPAVPVVGFVNRTWIAIESPGLNDPRKIGNVTLIQIRDEPFELMKSLQGNTNVKTIIRKNGSLRYNYGYAERLTAKVSEYLGQWSIDYVYKFFRYIDWFVDISGRFIASLINLARSYDCGGQIVEFIDLDEGKAYMVFVGSWTSGPVCDIPAINKKINDRLPKLIDDFKKSGQSAVKASHDHGNWYSDIRLYERESFGHPWATQGVNYPSYFW